MLNEEPILSSIYMITYLVNKIAISLSKISHNLFFNCRREKQLYENAIVEEYNEMFNIWRDMDYEYIAIYMGQKYAANLKKAEIAKEEEERAYYEKKVVLLQAQRNELLRRLRHTKQEFFLRAEVELSEIAELLYISRAFVFSYFDNVFGTR